MMDGGQKGVFGVLFHMYKGLVVDEYIRSTSVLGLADHGHIWLARKGAQHRGLGEEQVQLVGT